MSMSLEGLFEYSDLSKYQQSHLLKVYSILATGIMTSLCTFLLTQYIAVSDIIFVCLILASIVSEFVKMCLNPSSKFYNKVNFMSFYGYAVGIGGVFGNKIIGFDKEERLF